MAETSRLDFYTYESTATIDLQRTPDVPDFDVPVLSFRSSPCFFSERQRDRGEMSDCLDDGVDGDDEREVSCLTEEDLLSMMSVPMIAIAKRSAEESRKYTKDRKEFLNIAGEEDPRLKLGKRHCNDEYESFSISKQSKRQRVDDDSEMRHEIRKRNLVAARRSRFRKKSYVEWLVKRCETLTAKIDELNNYIEVQKERIETIQKVYSFFFKELKKTPENQQNVCE